MSSSCTCSCTCPCSCRQQRSRNFPILSELTLPLPLELQSAFIQPTLIDAVRYCTLQTPLFVEPTVVGTTPHTAHNHFHRTYSHRRNKSEPLYTADTRHPHSSNRQPLSQHQRARRGIGHTHVRVCGIGHPIPQRARGLEHGRGDAISLPQNPHHLIAMARASEDVERTSPQV